MIGHEFQARRIYANRDAVAHASGRIGGFDAGHTRDASQDDAVLIDAGDFGAGGAPARREIVEPAAELIGNHGTQRDCAGRDYRGARSLDLDCPHGFLRKARQGEEQSQQSVKPLPGGRGSVTH